MNNTENIWASLSKQLLVFIKSKVADRYAAEDILQEVFIKIHTRIGSLTDENKLKSWIYQIARNLIADYYRAYAKAGSEISMEPNQKDDEIDVSVMAEVVKDMIKMMEELPEEYREALRITELDGFSQKEYAMQTGITYTAAKSRVQRSRKLLKDMLMKCCHYQFDTYGTVLSIAPNICCCCCHPQK